MAHMPFQRFLNSFLETEGRTIAQLRLRFGYIEPLILADEPQPHAGERWRPADTENPVEKRPSVTNPSGHKKWDGSRGPRKIHPISDRPKKSLFGDFYPIGDVEYLSHGVFLPKGELNGLQKISDVSQIQKFLSLVD